MVDLFYRTFQFFRFSGDARFFHLLSMIRSEIVQFEVLVLLFGERLR